MNRNIQLLCLLLGSNMALLGSASPPHPLRWSIYTYSYSSDYSVINNKGKVVTYQLPSSPRRTICSIVRSWCTYPKESQR